MEEEVIWKPVVGYEDSYKVSNHGKVFSVDRMVKGNKENVYWFRRGCEIQPHLYKCGYLGLRLTKNGKPNFFYVHRIVADAFIANPQKLPFVNHKDENKTNNNAKNLEWCDRTYNNNYGTHNKRVGESNQIPILKYSLSGELLHEYSSAKEAETENGYKRGTICNCCKGRRKTAYGYVWKYKNFCKKEKRGLKDKIKKTTGI